MIKISELKCLTEADIESLGEYGYVSNDYYRVNRDEEEGNIKFTLSYESLEKPFEKKYELDLHHYGSIVSFGYSYAAYEGDELVGIILVEPQDWNNTLNIA